MRKPICFVIVLTVVFIATAFVAHAVSFEGDASYLFGISTKSQGFATHAMVEVIDQVFVDGSFLSTSVKSAGGDGPDSGLQSQLITVGGMYRPVADQDLEVFVGAGVVRLITKEEGAEEARGQGIYGKFGFKYLPVSKVSLIADVSYAPKYKEASAESHLVAARATLSYEVMDDLSVQGTVKHYRTQATSNRDTLVGGGVTFRF